MKLIYFSFSGYKNFQDRQEFYFIDKDSNVAKRVMLLGQTGTGKSTVLHALAMCLNYIESSMSGNLPNSWELVFSDKDNEEYSVQYEDGKIRNNDLINIGKPPSVVFANSYGWLHSSVPDITKVFPHIRTVDGAKEIFVVNGEKIHTSELSRTEHEVALLMQHKNCMLIMDDFLPTATLWMKSLVLDVLNKNNVNVVFTTSDPELYTLIDDPYCIWIVDYKELYCLIEFKNHKQYDFVHGFNHGRFGGITFDNRVETITLGENNGL